MDQLVSTFHIDWKLMLAQLVNFIIVLGVLYKFAYKPILKVLNDRTIKIEKGLKDAEIAQKKMEEIVIKEKEVMTEARREAQKILTEAESRGKKSQDEMVAEAKVKIDKTVEEAKNKIESEKAKMIQEVKTEISGLVVSATEKILGEKIDAKKDSELINQAIK